MSRQAREPQPAHAMRKARGAQADLGELEPVAHAHQAVLVRDLKPLELELAMTAVLFRPHDRDAAHDAPARLIAVEEKRGEPPARVVRCLRDQDEVPRHARAGDKPFAAFDAPGVPAPRGRGEDHRRIGAAAGMRLGHRECRAHAAIDDRLQPAFLLRVAGDFLQHHHVAVVRGGAIANHRAEEGVVQLLVASGHGGDVEALSAARTRHLRRPHAGFLRLVAQRLEQVLAQVVVLVEGFGRGVVRQDFLAREGAEAVAMALRLRRKREVHQSELITWPPSTTTVLPVM